MDAARVRSIRAHAVGIAVPPGLDDPTNLVTGTEHFAAHCAVCHGAPGVPKGDIAIGLYPQPPNLAEAAKHYTPGELFWIIKHGIKMTGMPAWGDHNDDELWATVAFIRKLPGLTEEGCAKLVAASRSQDGNHLEGHETQPQPRASQEAGEADHEHPTGHHH